MTYVNLFFAWLTSFSFTNTLFYLIPLCLVLAKSIKEVTKHIETDRVEREKYEQGKSNYYAPTATIGSMFYYLVVLPIIPLVNLIAAIFWAIPDFCRGALDSLSKFFNQPIVPKRERKVILNETK